MKKYIVSMTAWLLLLSGGVVFADELLLVAEDLGPALIRADFEIMSKSQSMGVSRRYEPKVLYIGKYQIIYIALYNGSSDIIHVNPNDFTLVSSKAVSYPYSSETYAFNDKIGNFPTKPIQAVNLYPSTKTKGFLLFDRSYKDEHPQKLYFHSGPHRINIDVTLDDKAKY